VPEAKRMLYCVLDWGLGHATRSIPVIEELLLQNHEVVLAANGNALSFLQEQFPALKSHELPAYNPVYPKGSHMVWAMAKQLPRFVQTINSEQKETERLVKEEKIDCVISDNRYGCYSKSVKSVFITHQVHLLMPAKWMEAGMNTLNRKLLSNYSECWIPAADDKLIPGLLQGREKLNTRFIGYLSRLKPMALPKKYKVLAVCSGPEPQRSIFERMVSATLQDAAYPNLIVRGVVNHKQKVFHSENNMLVVNHLNSEEMNHAIAESEMIISRSGYSTVMDLMKLGSKAIFVPTPGQTEQEYLARVLKQKRMAYSMPQSEFNLEKALKESEHYSGFQNLKGNSLLLKRAVETI
jgi:UDP:flavonoid glycosyltransferase YjiC (YdhE family)